MKKIFATLLALTILLTALQLSGCRDEIDDPEGTSELGAGTTLETATDGTAKDTTEDTTEDTTAESESEESLYIPESDTWDGSVATSFAKGSGTESDPYLITSAEQLAFLAKEINSGKNYTGKKFSLMCDIDLNNLEWTPIGNGDHSFDGSFDGNEHTIKNLKITEGIFFDKVYPHTTIKQYASGLFGVCEDFVIKNLTINDSEIIIQNTVDRYSILAGVLLGEATVNTSVEISNIKILNSSIVSDFTQESLATQLHIGGVGGHMSSEIETNIEISNIQSNVHISIENGQGKYNRIGGIWGGMILKNLCDIENCASYLSIDVDLTYIFDNYFGAFGMTQVSENFLSLTNVFSKVSVDKTYDSLLGCGAQYYANAIIGQAYHGKQQDLSVIGGYQFENVFGYVEENNTITDENQKFYQLYDMPSHAVYTETNCQSCEELPETHGFDENIWDLTDLKNPKLK